MAHEIVYNVKANFEMEGLSEFQTKMTDISHAVSVVDQNVKTMGNTLTENISKGATQLRGLETQTRSFSNQISGVQMELAETSDELAGRITAISNMAEGAKRDARIEETREWMAQRQAYFNSRGATTVAQAEMYGLADGVKRSAFKGMGGTYFSDKQSIGHDMFDMKTIMNQLKSYDAEYTAAIKQWYPQFAAKVSGMISGRGMAAGPLADLFNSFSTASLGGAGSGGEAWSRMNASLNQMVSRLVGESSGVVGSRKDPLLDGRMLTGLVRRDEQGKVTQGSREALKTMLKTALVSQRGITSTAGFNSQRFEKGMMSPDSFSTVNDYLKTYGKSLGGLFERREVGTEENYALRKALTEIMGGSSTFVNRTGINRLKQAATVNDPLMQAMIRAGSAYRTSGGAYKFKENLGAEDLRKTADELVQDYLVKLNGQNQTNKIIGGLGSEKTPDVKTKKDGEEVIIPGYYSYAAGRGLNIASGARAGSLFKGDSRKLIDAVAKARSGGNDKESNRIFTQAMSRTRAGGVATQDLRALDIIYELTQNQGKYFDTTGYGSGRSFVHDARTRENQDAYIIQTIAPFEDRAINRSGNTMLDTFDPKGKGLTKITENIYQGKKYKDSIKPQFTVMNENEITRALGMRHVNASEYTPVIKEIDFSGFYGGTTDKRNKKDQMYLNFLKDNGVAYFKDDQGDMVYQFGNINTERTVKRSTKKNDQSAIKILEMQYSGDELDRQLLAQGLATEEYTYKKTGNKAYDDAMEKALSSEYVYHMNHGQAGTVGRLIRRKEYEQVERNWRDKFTSPLAAILGIDSKAFGSFFGNGLDPTSTEYESFSKYAKFMDALGKGYSPGVDISGSSIDWLNMKDASGADIDFRSIISRLAGDGAEVQRMVRTKVARTPFKRLAGSNGGASAAEQIAAQTLFGNYDFTDPNNARLVQALLNSKFVSDESKQIINDRFTGNATGFITKEQREFLNRDFGKILNAADEVKWNEQTITPYVMENQIAKSKRIISASDTFDEFGKLANFNKFKADQKVGAGGFAPRVAAIKFDPLWSYAKDKNGNVVGGKEKKYGFDDLSEGIGYIESAMLAQGTSQIRGGIAAKGMINATQDLIKNLALNYGGTESVDAQTGETTYTYDAESAYGNGIVKLISKYNKAGQMIQSNYDMILPESTIKNTALMEAVAEAKRNNLKANQKSNKLTDAQIEEEAIKAANFTLSALWATTGINVMNRAENDASTNNIGVQAAQWLTMSPGFMKQQAKAFAKKKTELYDIPGIINLFGGKQMADVDPMVKGLMGGYEGISADQWMLENADEINKKRDDYLRSLQRDMAAGKILDFSNDIDKMYGADAEVGSQRFNLIKNSTGGFATTKYNNQRLVTNPYMVALAKYGISDDKKNKDLWINALSYLNNAKQNGSTDYQGDLDEAYKTFAADAAGTDIGKSIGLGVYGKKEFEYGIDKLRKMETALDKEIGGEVRASQNMGLTPEQLLGIITLTGFGDESKSLQLGAGAIDFDNIDNALLGIVRSPTGFGQVIGRTNYASFMSGVFEELGLGRNQQGLYLNYRDMQRISGADWDGDMVKTILTNKYMLNKKLTNGQKFAKVAGRGTDTIRELRRKSDISNIKRNDYATNEEFVAAIDKASETASLVDDIIATEEAFKKIAAFNGDVDAMEEYVNEKTHAEEIKFIGDKTLNKDRKQVQKLTDEAMLRQIKGMNWAQIKMGSSSGAGSRLSIKDLYDPKESYWSKVAFMANRFYDIYTTDAKRPTSTEMTDDFLSALGLNAEWGKILKLIEGADDFDTTRFRDTGTYTSLNGNEILPENLTKLKNGKYMYYDPNTGISRRNQGGLGGFALDTMQFMSNNNRQHMLATLQVLEAEKAGLNDTTWSDYFSEGFTKEADYERDGNNRIVKESIGKGTDLFAKGILRKIDIDKERAGAGGGMGYGIFDYLDWTDENGNAVQGLDKVKNLMKNARYIKGQQIGGNHMIITQEERNLMALQVAEAETQIKTAAQSIFNNLPRDEEGLKILKRLNPDYDESKYGENEETNQEYKNYTLGTLTSYLRRAAGIPAISMMLGGYNYRRGDGKFETISAGITEDKLLEMLFSNDTVKEYEAATLLKNYAPANRLDLINLEANPDFYDTEGYVSSGYGADITQTLERLNAYGVDIGTLMNPNAKNAAARTLEVAMQGKGKWTTEEIEKRVDKILNNPEAIKAYEAEATKLNIADLINVGEMIRKGEKATVFDVETTGTHNTKDQILQLSGSNIYAREYGKDEFDEYIAPNLEELAMLNAEEVAKASSVTHLDPRNLVNNKGELVTQTRAEVLPDFMTRFAAGSRIGIGFNSGNFDNNILATQGFRAGLTDRAGFEFNVDALEMIKTLNDYGVGYDEGKIDKEGNKRKTGLLEYLNARVADVYANSVYESTYEDLINGIKEEDINNVLNGPNAGASNREEAINELKTSYKINALQAAIKARDNINKNPLKIEKGKLVGGTGSHKLTTIVGAMLGLPTESLVDNEEAHSSIFDVDMTSALYGEEMRLAYEKAYEDALANGGSQELLDSYKAGMAFYTNIRNEAAEKITGQKKFKIENAYITEADVDEEIAKRMKRAKEEGILPKEEAKAAAEEVAKATETPPVVPAPTAPRMPIIVPGRNGMVNRTFRSLNENSSSSKQSPDQTSEQPKREISNARAYFQETFKESYTDDKGNVVRGTEEILDDIIRNITSGISEVVNKATGKPSKDKLEKLQTAYKEAIEKGDYAAALKMTNDIQAIVGKSTDLDNADVKELASMVTDEKQKVADSLEHTPIDKDRDTIEAIKRRIGTDYDFQETIKRQEWNNDINKAEAQVKNRGTENYKEVDDEGKATGREIRFRIDEEGVVDTANRAVADMQWFTDMRKQLDEVKMSNAKANYEFAETSQEAIKNKSEGIQKNKLMKVLQARAAGVEIETNPLLSGIAESEAGKQFIEYVRGDRNGGLVLDYVKGMVNTIDKSSKTFDQDILNTLSGKSKAGAAYGRYATLINKRDTAIADLDAQRLALGTLFQRNDKNNEMEKRVGHDKESKKGLKGAAEVLKAAGYEINGKKSPNTIYNEIMGKINTAKEDIKENENFKTLEGLMRNDLVNAARRENNSIENKIYGSLGVTKPTHDERVSEYSLGLAQDIQTEMASYKEMETKGFNFEDPANAKIKAERARLEANKALVESRPQRELARIQAAENAYDKMIKDGVTLGYNDDFVTWDYDPNGKYTAADIARIKKEREDAQARKKEIYDENGNLKDGYTLYGEENIKKQEERERLEYEKTNALKDSQAGRLAIRSRRQRQSHYMGYLGNNMISNAIRNSVNYTSQLESTQEQLEYRKADYELEYQKAQDEYEAEVAKKERELELELEKQKQNRALTKEEKESIRANTDDRKVRDAKNRADTVDKELDKVGKEIKGNKGFKGFVKDLAGQGIQILINQITQLIKATAQFELAWDKAMAGVAAKSNLAGESLKNIEETIQNQAVALKVSSVDLANIYKDLFAAGFDNTNIEKAAEIMVKFSTVTGQNATKAIKELTQMVNTGLVSSLEVAMDKLTAVSDIAVSSAADISKVISKMSSVATSSGMTSNEAIALATFASDTMGGSSTVGSDIGMILSRLGSLSLATSSTTSGNTYTDSEGRKYDISQLKSLEATTGVQFLSSNSYIRDPFAILKDVAANWYDMNDAQRSSFIGILGGTSGRQANTFSSIMNAWAADPTKMDDIMNSLVNSTGTVDEQYSTMTDTLEASKTQANSAFMNWWHNNLGETITEAKQDFYTAVAELFSGETLNNDTDDFYFDLDDQIKYVNGYVDQMENIVNKYEDLDDAMISFEDKQNVGVMLQELITAFPELAESIGNSALTLEGFNEILDELIEKKGELVGSKYGNYVYDTDFTKIAKSFNSEVQDAVANTNKMLFKVAGSDGKDSPIWNIVSNITETPSAVKGNAGSYISASSVPNGFNSVGGHTVTDYVDTTSWDATVANTNDIVGELWYESHKSSYKGYVDFARNVAALRENDTYSNRDKVRDDVLFLYNYVAKKRLAAEDPEDIEKYDKILQDVFNMDLTEKGQEANKYKVGQLITKYATAQINALYGSAEGFDDESKKDLIEYYSLMLQEEYEKSGYKMDFMTGDILSKTLSWLQQDVHALGAYEEDTSTWNKYNWSTYGGEPTSEREEVRSAEWGNYLQNKYDTTYYYKNANGEKVYLHGLTLEDAEYDYNKNHAGETTYDIKKKYLTDEELANYMSATEIPEYETTISVKINTEATADTTSIDNAAEEIADEIVKVPYIIKTKTEKTNTDGLNIDGEEVIETNKTESDLNYRAMAAKAMEAGDNLKEQYFAALAAYNDFSSNEEYSKYFIPYNQTLLDKYGKLYSVSVEEYAKNLDEIYEIQDALSNVGFNDDDFLNYEYFLDHKYDNQFSPSTAYMEYVRGSISPENIYDYQFYYDLADEYSAIADQKDQEQNELSKNGIKKLTKTYIQKLPVDKLDLTLSDEENILTEEESTTTKTSNIPDFIKFDSEKNQYYIVENLTPSEKPRIYRGNDILAYPTLGDYMETYTSNFDTTTSKGVAKSIMNAFGTVGNSAVGQFLTKDGEYWETYSDPINKLLEDNENIDKIYQGISTNEYTYADLYDALAEYVFGENIETSIDNFNATLEKVKTKTNQSSRLIQGIATAEDITAIMDYYNMTQAQWFALSSEEQKSKYREYALDVNLSAQNDMEKQAAYYQAILDNGADKYGDSNTSIEERMNAASNIYRFSDADSTTKQDAYWYWLAASQVTGENSLFKLDENGNVVVNEDYDYYGTNGLKTITGSFTNATRRNLTNRVLSYGSNWYAKTNEELANGTIAVGELEDLAANNSELVEYLALLDQYNSNPDEMKDSDKVRMLELRTKLTFDVVNGDSTITFLGDVTSMLTSIQAGGYAAASAISNLYSTLSGVSSENSMASYLRTNFVNEDGTYNIGAMSPNFVSQLMSATGASDYETFMADYNNLINNWLNLVDSKVSESKQGINEMLITDLQEKYDAADRMGKLAVRKEAIDKGFTVDENGKIVVSTNQKKLNDTYEAYGLNENQEYTGEKTNAFGYLGNTQLYNKRDLLTIAGTIATTGKLPEGYDATKNADELKAAAELVSGLDVYYEKAKEGLATPEETKAIQLAARDAMLSFITSGFEYNTAKSYYGATTETAKATALSSFVTANQSFNTAKGLVTNAQGIVDIVNMWDGLSDTEKQVVASVLGMSVEEIGRNKGLAQANLNAKETDLMNERSEAFKKLADAAEEAGMSIEDYAESVDNNVITDTTDEIKELAAAYVQLGVSIDNVAEALAKVTDSAKKSAEVTSNKNDFFSTLSSSNIPETVKSMEDLYNWMVSIANIDTEEFAQAFSDIANMFWNVAENGEDVDAATVIRRILGLSDYGESFTEEELNKEYSDILGYFTTDANGNYTGITNENRQALIDRWTTNYTDAQREQLKELNPALAEIVTNGYNSDMWNTYNGGLGIGSKFNQYAKNTAIDKMFLPFTSYKELLESNGNTMFTDTGLYDALKSYVLGDERTRAKLINEKGQEYGNVKVAYEAAKAYTSGNTLTKYQLSDLGLDEYATDDQIKQAANLAISEYEYYRKSLAYLGNSSIEGAEDLAISIKTTADTVLSSAEQSDIKYSKDANTETKNNALLNDFSKTLTSEMSIESMIEAANKFAIENQDILQIDAFNTWLSSLRAQSKGTVAATYWEDAMTGFNEEVKAKGLPTYTYTDDELTRYFELIKNGTFDTTYMSLSENQRNDLKAALTNKYGSGFVSDNFEYQKTYNGVGEREAAIRKAEETARTNYLNNLYNDQGLITKDVYDSLTTIAGIEYGAPADIEQQTADFIRNLEEQKTTYESKVRALNSYNLAEGSETDKKWAFLNAIGESDINNFDKLYSQYTTDTEQFANYYDMMRLYAGAQYGFGTELARPFDTSAVYNLTGNTGSMYGESATDIYGSQMLNYLISGNATPEEFNSMLMNNAGWTNVINSSTEAKAAIEGFANGQESAVAAAAKLQKALKKDASALDSFNKSALKSRETLSTLRYYLDKKKYDKGGTSEESKELMSLLGIGNETLKKMTDDEIRRQLQSSYDKTAEEYEDLLNSMVDDFKITDEAMLKDLSEDQEIELGGVTLVAGETKTVGIDEAIAMAQALGQTAIADELESLKAMYGQIELTTQLNSDGTISAYYGNAQITANKGSRGSSSSGSGKSAAAKLLEKWKRSFEVDKHQINMVKAQETKYKDAGNLASYGNMVELENVAQQKQIVKYKKAISEIQAQMKKTSKSKDDWYDLRDAVMEYEEAIEDCKNTIAENNRILKENREAMRQTRTELENMIKDAIEANEEFEDSKLAGTVNMQDTILNALKQRYQDEWDLMKEDLQKKRDALEEEKNLINERLQARKDAESEASEYEQLAELQKQLALISMDSTMSKEAADLRAQIAEKQNALAWKQAEESTAATTEALENQINGIDQYMSEEDQRVAEYLEDANNFADQVASVLGMSSDEIMTWLADNVEEYGNLLDAAQKQQVESWLDTYKQMMGITDLYWTMINSIIDGGWGDVMEYMQTTQEYQNASATGKLEQIYSWQTAFDEYTNAFEGTQISKAYDEYMAIIEKAVDNGDQDLAEKYLNGYIELMNGNAKYSHTDVFKSSTGNVTEKIASGTEHISANTDIIVSVLKNVDKLANLLNSDLVRYADGGVNTMPGIAWLDGTMSNPEYIFNSEQMKALSKTGFMPFMSQIGSDLFGGSSSSMGDVIVTINQAEISSDYDVERLASLVGDKFVEQISTQGYRTSRF